MFATKDAHITTLLIKANVSVSVTEDAIKVTLWTRMHVSVKRHVVYHTNMGTMHAIDMMILMPVTRRINTVSGNASNFFHFVYWPTFIELNIIIRQIYCLHAVHVKTVITVAHICIVRLTNKVWFWSRISVLISRWFNQWQSHSQLITSKE